MKKGDVAGLVSIVVLLSMLGSLFAFSPERSRVAFTPVEVAGSTLVLVEAGDLGVVVDAVLGEPGFITLHDTIGDAPSTIISSSNLLKSGIHSAFTLSVPEGLDPLQSYVMLMTADDGDGVYEPGVDRPVMVNGQVIRVPVEFTSDEGAL